MDMRLGLRVSDEEVDSRVAPQSTSSQIEPFSATSSTPPHSHGSPNITDISSADEEKDVCASIGQTQANDDVTGPLLSSDVTSLDDQVQSANVGEYFAKEDLAYSAHEHFQEGDRFENPNHSNPSSIQSENYYCDEERSDTYVRDFQSFATAATSNGTNREELSETQHSNDQLHYLLNGNNRNCFDVSSSSINNNFEQDTYIFNSDHNHVSSEWHSIVTRSSSMSSPNRHEISNVNSTQGDLYGKGQAPLLPGPIPTTTSYSTISPYLPGDENEQNLGRRSLYSEPVFRSWQQQQTIRTESTGYHRKDTSASLDQRPNSKFEEVCDNVEECNQRTLPLGMKTTINSLSNFPSFMEPSRPNFQHLACCDDPCCKEACGYDGNSWNGTDNNSDYAALVQYQPSSMDHTDSRSNVPTIRWNENLTNQGNSPIPSQNSSLPTNNRYFQSQSHKRAIQDNFFVDMAYNESNSSSYLLPTISNVQRKPANDIFCKRTKSMVNNSNSVSIIASDDGNSEDMLMPITSSIGFGNHDAMIQKYESYQLRPKIDLNDNIPETPEPPFDVSDQRPDSRPRRQKLKYPGDMYTPQWVRYSGHSKEGYCDNCKPGKWLQLKNSAYWYHKQFYHGISSVSGKMFVPPLETRKFETGDCTEGLCHQCNQWVPISTSKKKNSMLWFRHAHKCHVYVKPKNYPPSGKRR
ncbi:4504_t:CDS:2 [Acaulospora colombiana]|uniref:4504_t:CDS:1 n=1 Tax=Acaulospora colombiana TaxID=27376 RepID=A0ACA9L7F5_9GLOM|nr:4504_t:CDS:2 [Acaulospora colombiana]